MSSEENDSNEDREDDLRFKCVSCGYPVTEEPGDLHESCVLKHLQELKEQSLANNNDNDESDNGNQLRITLQLLRFKRRKKIRSQQMKKVNKDH